MRTLLAVLSLIVCSGFVAAPIASAQESLDIEAVAKMVLARDPEDILLALNSAIVDEQLPDAFSGPTLTDLAPGEGNTVSAEDLTGGIGNVMYTVTYTPPASPDASPTASPAANRGGVIYNAASLNYIVLDHEIDDTTLAEFDSAARTTVGSSPEQTQVETITVGNTNGYLISTSSIANGLQVIIQWIAIPVGTVMVVSQLMIGGEQVDVATLQTMNESLAFAGVQHLGMITGPRG